MASPSKLNGSGGDSGVRRRRAKPEVQVVEAVGKVRVRSRLGLGPLEELVVYGSSIVLGAITGLLIGML